MVACTWYEVLDGAFGCGTAQLELPLVSWSGVFDAVLQKRIVPVGGWLLQTVAVSVTGSFGWIVPVIGCPFASVSASVVVVNGAVDGQAAADAPAEPAVAQTAAAQTAQASSSRRRRPELFNFAAGIEVARSYAGRATPRYPRTRDSDAHSR